MKNNVSFLISWIWCWQHVRKIWDWAELLLCFDTFSLNKSYKCLGTEVFSHYVFQKEFQNWICLTTEHFTVLPQSILSFGPDRGVELLDHIDLSFLLYTTELKCGFVDTTVNRLYGQWFLEVSLRPRSDFHIFNVVLPDSPKIASIQYWFSALSFAHRDFSRILW